MKHVDPNKLPIVLSRAARLSLAKASDEHWWARYHRDRARHSLRTWGNRSEHRLSMQTALIHWKIAKQAYREARTNG